MSQQVYLMKNSLGLFKVGISNNPGKRCRDISNSSGFPVEVVKVWSALNARRTERQLHNHYADLRKNGEWFDFSGIALQDVFSCVVLHGGLDDIPPPPIRIKHIATKPPCFTPPCWRSLCKLEDSVRSTPQTVSAIHDRIELQATILKNMLLETKLDLRDLSIRLTEMGFNVPFLWTRKYAYSKSGVFDLERQANCLQRAIPICKGRHQELQYNKVYTLEWLTILENDISLHRNRLSELNSQLAQFEDRPHLRLVA